VVDRPGAAEPLAQLVHDAASILIEAGLPPDAARAEAALLARWCLGWDATTWLTRASERPPDGFGARFAACVRRRARREPVSHIVGTREFYGRSFEVTADVLTPRPETELVVDESLRVLSAREPAARPLRIVDVGTGSGCLAATLALETARSGVSPARVLAVDVSPSALQVARRNAARLGAAASIRFVRGDLLASIAANAVDLVVANPPYVADTERDRLPPEVGYEPAAALFAGPDGLDVIRRLVPESARVLKPCGHLVMEIGHDQGEAVRAIVRAESGLEGPTLARDLAGHPRVVVTRRRERL